MLYRVTVKPGSKKGPLVVATSVNSVNASHVASSTVAPTPELTVYLREKPIAGAANFALIKLLAQHFDVAKSCIAIKSGAASRTKLVEVLQNPTRE